MKRFLPLFLIAILLVVAIVATLWATQPRAPATITALADLNYAEAESWAVRPEAPPPAVWESGWDIDVVLVSAGAAIEPGEAETAGKRFQDSAKSLSDLSAAFAPIGPVYAPLLRRAKTSADLEAALRHYLAEDNRGRAFVIATDTVLPDSFASSLAADPLLRDRFAGILTFGDTPQAAGFAPGTNKADVCSRRYEAAETCTLTVDLRRTGGSYTISGDGPPGGHLVDGFTNWLHGNASKLAEPLGDLEEIEIIEIQMAPEGQ